MNIIINLKNITKIDTQLEQLFDLKYNTRILKFYFLSFCEYIICKLIKDNY